jgi:plastocyanin
MRSKLIFVLCALALAGVACSSKTSTPSTPAASSPPAASPSPSASPAATVTMVDALKFVPDSVSVKAGDTVEWKNTGSAPHTVTADDGSFDSGTSTPINAGGTYDHTFPTAGTFKYHCTIHPQMKATVVVT